MKNVWKDKRLIKIAASLCLLAVFLCLSLVGTRGGITVEPAGQSGLIQGGESTPDGGNGGTTGEGGQIGEDVFVVLRLLFLRQFRVRRPVFHRSRGDKRNL